MFVIGENLTAAYFNNSLILLL